MIEKEIELQDELLKMNSNDNKINLNKKCSVYNIKYPDIEIIYRNKSDKRSTDEIYTDGSKFNNHVGASMVVYKNSNCIYQQGYRLNDSATVYMAELLAINKAIDYVLQNRDRDINSFDIISDSLSALQSIVSLNENRLFITTMRNKIDNLGINIKWTKAHVGDPGNEAADELAKLSTTKDSIDIEFQLSKSQLRKKSGFEIQ